MGAGEVVEAPRATLVVDVRGHATDRRAGGGAIGFGSSRTRAAATRRIAWAVALVVAGTISACAPVEPPTPRPSFPGSSTLEVVGIVAGERGADGVAGYTLEDGRTIEIDTSTSRAIHRGAGSSLLLVVATDPAGRWWATVGTQDGMPEDCLVLNEAGTDRGPEIVVAGVAWRKSPAFTSDTGVVPAGTDYPDGTRFCLDTFARVELATTR